MDLDRLLAIGETCIRNEPPACLASCPLHLDVIGMMKAIEQDDFTGAYRILEKRMPFPQLVGKICDHPCESVCVRNNLDDGLKIGELEKAVLEYGYALPKKKLPIKRTKGKVAVIGGGISGLVAAQDLANKGYQITIYEKEDKLGGYFWNFSGQELEEEKILGEMQKVASSNIEVVLNMEVDQKKLAKILDENDGVYLGTGQWEKAVTVDYQTFQTETEKVFAGGSLVLEKDSVISGISSGRRAAVSLDRYIAGVSMMASREREGVFETPLQYKTDDVEEKAAIQPQETIYSREEAVLEAARCLKCQCDACIKACVHMQRFDMTPDAYIRQINQSERIILGTHYANKMINSCTECGLCEEVCFKGISMKDIIKETRESMVERSKMPLSAHDFALKDMKFSNGSHFNLVRKQPDKESSKELFYYPKVCYDPYVRGLYKGTGKTGYLFYPGCQLSASHHEYIEEIYRYLVGSIKDRGTEDDVGIYLGCCGAPADWAGRKDLANENIDKIRAVWEEMDRPVFILACSSCMAVFEKYLPEIETISLWEIYDKYGLPKPEVRSGRPVLYVHDACSTRSNHKIHESIRNLANKMGYEIKELPYSKEETKCCGYGGLVYYANREQSRDFSQDRMKETPGDLLVYCAMCKDLMVSEGQRTFHILDLIYGQDLESAALRKNPTLSKRHENRIQVKRNLLKNVWNENEKEEPKMENLNYNENVESLMEERYILQEDLEQVVQNALKNDRYFYDQEKDEYLARLRIDEVTFWARFKKENSGINLLNTYSHRMEVVEE